MRSSWSSSGCSSCVAGATVSQLIARVAQRGRPPHDHGLGVRRRPRRHRPGRGRLDHRARDTFAAVVGFVAYGLLLALVWVRLAAPDVALTEAAIGGGVTGVLLLGAAARLRGTAARPAAERPGAALRLVAGVLCAAVAAALAAAVLLLPDPAPDARAGRRGEPRRRPASAIRSPPS